jgi:hypothetical protein
VGRETMAAGVAAGESLGTIAIGEECTPHRIHNTSLAADRNPSTADLYVGSLDRGPGNAMRRFLLARIAAMSGKGMVEGLAINVLRVRRQVRLHRRGKILVAAVRQEPLGPGWT